MDRQRAAAAADFVIGEVLKTAHNPTSRLASSSRSPPSSAAPNSCASTWRARRALRKKSARSSIACTTARRISVHSPAGTDKTSPWPVPLIDTERLMATQPGDYRPQGPVPLVGTSECGQIWLHGASGAQQWASGLLQGKIPPDRGREAQSERLNRPQEVTPVGEPDACCIGRLGSRVAATPALVADQRAASMALRLK